MPENERIAILGQGYVGLPLSLAFTNHNKVVGYDVSESYVSELKEKHGDTKIVFTSDEKDMKNCTVFIICVPTPLREDGRPDLSYVKDATETISRYLKKGDMVILESTTYPGTTREVLGPMLERSGLHVESDFDLVFSPERIDPGNKNFNVANIPKLVGGTDKKATERAVRLYEQIITEVHPVDSPEIAESAKIMENIFRNVNIALVNELSLIFEKMDIDIWKVIEAASTKPFGFMAFYPGPGVGGHCIPLDPHYLSYQARKYDMLPRFIELSSDINRFMPIHTVNLARKGLESVGKELKDSTVCVFGLSYKAGIEDTREAPSFKVIEELESQGSNVLVYDPYVHEITVAGKTYSTAGSLEETLSKADCAMFLVDHDEFKVINWNEMSKKNDIVVVDTKNIFEWVEGAYYIGLGKPSMRK